MYIVAHLLLDILCGELGGLQVLHESRVSEEVPAGRGETGEQGVF